MNLTKISGWYRLLIIASIIWIIVSLVTIDPWTQNYSPFPFSETTNLVSHWDKFFRIGILPVVILWGLIWVINGFRNKKRKQMVS